ncbi:MAG TPA: endonuclease/exonuclease/phosphatase family protein [Candidatus Binatia bacterium]|jgi:endonuclease/exonuclease/phosphatase family metal-dependent hydrolase
MSVRVATLNLEQNHKCWDARRHLIVEQFAEIKPDIQAFNEIHIPTKTGRWLQAAVTERVGERYALLRQPKAGADGAIQAEGLLTRIPVVETASLDYQSHDCVAMVARFQIERRIVDFYVTHLIAARISDEARQEQATKLIEWTRSRSDANHKIICGDFNAAPDQPSIQLMLAAFRLTQTAHTAFTPLQEPAGEPTHPEWPRFDRCIDYIWVSEGIQIEASGLCYNRPAPDNPLLWPSDHVGVWADLKFV